ncbi:hypothetical protein D3C76_1119820 [compost metagenome]
MLAEVVEQVHPHALGLEPAGGLGDFIACHLGQGLGGDVGGAALERVVGCGFRVGGEGMRPDHDHCCRCLNGTRWKCHVKYQVGNRVRQRVGCGFWQRDRGYG